ncbi:MAG TPA: sigma-54-dependent Fis family transcriptional regulator, partial [Firmicutes bacterium]|nr:sigma-54-dependent Fis family transcriptional regulator [Bacillota bacterium]
MQLEHALLEVVLSHSNEGIHMVDTNGITKYYNAAAAIMDGLEPSEVLGKHVLEIFPSLDRGTSTLLKVARTGKPIVDQQQVYTNVKGVEISTVNTTLPIFGQEGNLLGAV